MKTEVEIRKVRYIFKGRWKGSKNFYSVPNSPAFDDGDTALKFWNAFKDCEKQFDWDEFEEIAIFKYYLVDDQHVETVRAATDDN